jgi:hypothetical protein
MITNAGKVAKAIKDEGNGGLHVDEIAYTAGIPEAQVLAALADPRFAEVEPGVWKVVR